MDKNLKGLFRCRRVANRCLRSAEARGYVPASLLQVLLKTELSIIALNPDLNNPLIVERIEEIFKSENKHIGFPIFNGHGIPDYYLAYLDSHEIRKLKN